MTTCSWVLDRHPIVEGRSSPSLGHLPLEIEYRVLRSLEKTCPWSACTISTWVQQYSENRFESGNGALILPIR